LDNLIETNIILIVLPYLSVVPIYNFLGCMIKEPLTADGKTISNRLLRAKFIIGAIITSLIMGSCIILMFVISANQTDQERISWTADFIIIIAMDFLLGPFLIILSDIFYRYVFFRTAKSRGSKTGQLMYKLLSDYNLQEINNHINKKI